MTAGAAADQVNFNHTIGNAVIALAQALDNCAAINTMLGNAERGFDTAGLLALGFTQDDVTLIQDSFQALALLQQVAYGQIAQSGASPSNFFFQAQQLMGTVPL